MFDKLLLICEGQVAYYGEAKKCAQYFAALGLPCPTNYNIADHIRKLRLFILPLHIGNRCNALLEDIKPSNVAGHGAEIASCDIVQIL